MAYGGLNHFKSQNLQPLAYKSYFLNGSLAKVVRKTIALKDDQFADFLRGTMFLQKARRDFSKQQSADRFFSQLLTQLESVTTCI
jgi:hypothetical protein